jgi:hypothetical protein
MASGSDRRKKSDDDLDWFTISYRTLYSAAALLVVAAAVFLYLRYGRTPQRAAPAPAQPTSVTTARFTSLEGSVKVKAVGTFEWVSADRKMTLKKSDLVRTGPGSAAEITFFDGTVVHVRPDSLITIEETSEDPSTKQRRVAWHISSGEVNFQTVRHNVPGSATEISTPTIKGRVGENAAANIRVAEGGDSDIRLFRGNVRGETKKGQKVELNANEGLKVDAAGQAGAKVTLPPPPGLLAPQHQAEISYADSARATTLFLWKAVPQAASYRVMLDVTPSFNQPFSDQRNVKDASLEVRGLQEGRYYWRVAAVDKDGNEGAFSDFAGFTVTKAAAAAQKAAPPPLSIDSLDVRTQILQIKGRTEPGATLTVNGQRIDVQSDGSFNEFLTLEKLGKQTILVRAVGINGGVNEQRRSVTASY